MYIKTQQTTTRKTVESFLKVLKVAAAPLNNPSLFGATASWKDELRPRSLHHSSRNDRDLTVSQVQSYQAS